MKKIIALFALVSVFGFVACNNAAETTEEGAEEAVENAEAEAESLLDQAEEAEMTTDSVEVTEEEATEEEATEEEAAE